jgi:hypothetical protein
MGRFLDPPERINAPNVLRRHLRPRIIELAKTQKVDKYYFHETSNQFLRWSKGLKNVTYHNKKTFFQDLLFADCEFRYLANFAAGICIF